LGHTPTKTALCYVLTLNSWVSSRIIGGPAKKSQAFMATLYGREQSLSSSVLVIYFCYAAGRGSVQSVCKYGANAHKAIPTTRNFNYNKPAWLQLQNFQSEYNALVPTL